MAKEKPDQPRGRGRPKVDAKPMMVRLRPNEMRRLDAVIDHHGGGLSRPEAIRRIVEKTRPNVLGTAE